MPPRPSKPTPDRSPPGDDGMLWRILEGTASATGEEFFRALVENLAQAMGVYSAFLTEYDPEHATARTLADEMKSDRRLAGTASTKDQGRRTNEHATVEHIVETLDAEGAPLA